ncbi:MULTISPECIES: Crp/Fnr family transcriptional regulator [unclassified Aureispira]|uniref:Crp/Fnr family transcriptional regulator n=1 Tax=unclassified Aureispira TaxID=2649989 RepID=UPI000AD53110|nr:MULTISPECIES: Crp/Fnr family transcriptional regulator [unclassified Aureispira]WMX17004.1 Crp/Fnr family transcriptional regulator [Aureispira sp. CCB-E]
MNIQTMKEQLIKNISKHIRLSVQEIDLFKTFWTEKKLDKGDYLLRNGATCRTDNYIVSGCLKAFYINSNTGREEVLYFAIEDWWATDIDSFQKQTPSIYNIQALEETQLLQISHYSFNRMLEQMPKLEKYFRIILESYLGSLQRRIIENNLLGAEQRYIEFIERYPQIANRVPQYLIASYLGISAEFLSRIRRKQKID